MGGFDCEVVLRFLKNRPSFKIHLFKSKRYAEEQTKKERTEH